VVHLDTSGPIVNKTIYLPDDEAETWEKARRLANDRLSPVILGALKEYIMTKEAEATEAAGFERIELECDDDKGLPARKAFYGRWIFSPGKPLRVWKDAGQTLGNSYAVAYTAKGSVAVYMWRHENDYDPDIGDFEATSDYKLLVFRSFEEAAQNQDVSYAVREAVRRRGVPVEELDI
jgi:hypothetical protein